MKKAGLSIFIIFLAVACNNAGNSTKSRDSTAVKDKTNMYDTGTGSSMTDTSHHIDTSLVHKKTKDAGAKK